MYVLPSTWQPSTAYAQNGVRGDYVVPSAGKATAFIYRCVLAGTSGSAEPVWPLALGTTVLESGGPEWVCASLAPLISQQDIEDRISRAIVTALLDDNVDGFADAGPVARVLVDSTSYVMGLIGGVYDFPIGSPYPNELQRICLDVAVGYLAVRHPEVVRFDGYAMLDRARVELKDLKDGISQLDIPMLGATVGAVIVPPTPLVPRAGNIGGFVVDGANRLVIDSPDGTKNGGDY